MESSKFGLTTSARLFKSVNIETSAPPIGGAFFIILTLSIMIKRTLCFSNPAYICLRNRQLVVRIPDGKSPSEKQDVEKTIPIEDIGVVVLDSPQISLTHGILAALLENNVAVISCNDKHLPTGLLLPLEGNTLQSERFSHQISASLPLKKQLWQQTVVQKIRNQASSLKRLTNAEVGNMLAWSHEVRSGDADNLEGRAAAYYWATLFQSFPGCTRGQNAPWPNPLFNYGYAILRAIVARSLVASGLLPTLGIHHHNRYNAYCLADDIMEPYRPYVDMHVFPLISRWPDAEELTTEMKRELLSIPVIDVIISGQRSPLMVAVSQTSASLYKCFSGELRKILYPELSMT